MIDFTFKPVEVKGGRKFKGHAYFLGRISSYSVAYGVECESAELWDSVNLKIVYANPKFMSDRVEDETITCAAKNAYIDEMFKQTISYCLAKSADKSDVAVRSFARNCMLKKFPDWVDEIEKRLPDLRNAYDEIEKTLTWAMSRKTQPMLLYGRACKGGREIPEKKKINMAIASLRRRRIDSMPGYRDALSLALTLRGLNEYLSCF